MTSEAFLYYLELALKNLDMPKTGRFNIEGELLRLLDTYSLEQVKEKVGELSFRK